MTTTANDLQLKPLGMDDLKSLADVNSDGCVSIQMPTHRSGREVQQNSIRFKNLLDVADDKLKTAGGDTSILDPLRSLPNDDDFWQHQSDGLAVFIDTVKVQLFSTQHPVPKRVTVGDSFYLASLLCELSAREEYYVLALTWDEAKLYIGSGNDLCQVESSDFPAEYKDLVLPRDPEEQLQFMTHRAGGESTAMYHGHGEGEEKIEADRRNYLSRVGDLVSSELYNTGKPLVVVATDQVAGHFAAATKVDAAARVEGSPAVLSDDELRTRARDAISPKLAEDVGHLIERFGTALAQSKASGDPAEVATAALQGRVDVLIVAGEADAYGTLDREKLKASSEDGGEVDLINVAVVETLRNGGTTYGTGQDAMPANSKGVAATFRY